MQITRSSLDTNPGPADWFTGSVFIDAIATPGEGSPNPSYGTPRAIFNPRQVQFALRFTW